MLDLNVEIVSSDSSSCGDTRVLVMAVDEEEGEEEVVEEVEERKNLIGVPVGEEVEEEEEEEEEQSVGTSDSSSVVNADKSPANGGEENTSSAAAAAFVFDVFKKDKERSSGSPSALITRQLFPVHSGGAAELGLGQPTTAAVPRTQWLNLSVARDSGRESGGPLLAGKLGNFQPEKQQQVRKSRRGPRSRSSQYRGVTFYRRTGRWESHIWDCGKQVYLGGFDTAYAAARAYDRAAIKFRGVDADINFSISDYKEDMKQVGNLTKEEFVRILRKRSTSFPRPNSKYRGIGLQKCGQLDDRVGQFLGAHDSTVIQYNGQRSVANLERAGYEGEIVLGAAAEGGGSHDLNLNLGMAPPSGDSKKIKVAGSYRLPSSELAMVDSSNVSAPSKRLPVWPATYPFLLPTSEGRAMERRRAEAQTSSNIGWQISNNGNYGDKSASPLMISSGAASSGFPSSFSSNSPSTHHPYKVSAVPQNPISSQLLLSKHSSISVNPFPFSSLGHKGGPRH